jgi:hypothetical protein
VGIEENIDAAGSGPVFLLMSTSSVSNEDCLRDPSVNNLSARNRYTSALGSYSLLYIHQKVEMYNTLSDTLYTTAHVGRACVRKHVRAYVRTYMDVACIHTAYGRDGCVGHVSPLRRALLRLLQDLLHVLFVISRDRVCLYIRA